MHYSFAFCRHEVTASCGSFSHLNMTIIGVAPLASLEKVVRFRDAPYLHSSGEVATAVNHASRKLTNVKGHSTRV